MLEQVLSDFNITGTIENIRTGPIVTLFEFQPSAGNLSCLRDHDTDDDYADYV